MGLGYTKADREVDRQFPGDNSNTQSTGQAPSELKDRSGSGSVEKNLLFGPSGVESA